jgi:hypothetical protein
MCWRSEPEVYGKSALAKQRTDVPLDKATIYGLAICFFGGTK